MPAGDYLKGNLAESEKFVRTLLEQNGLDNVLQSSSIMVADYTSPCTVNEHLRPLRPLSFKMQSPSYSFSIRHDWFLSFGAVQSRQPSAV